MIWPFKTRTTKQIARIEIKGVINSETRKFLLEALETVKEKKFPALLLRIDSPGGTVGDSQEIYEALKKLQKKTKIVATFGNISASGGVYISMGAPYIMANPGTITGSIGVILRGNNFKELLNKIGVSFQVVKSGPYKDILSFDRQLSPEEEKILQEMIDISYQQFITTISKERNLDMDKTKSFADGRIFTGEQALRLGMVDRLGSEEDARCWAAELVGLDPEKTKCFTIEESKPFLNRVFSKNNNKSKFTLMNDRIEFELKTSGQLLWLYQQ